MPKKLIPAGAQSFSAIGRRLRWTREALGYNARVFASMADVKENTYNQAETGRQRIGLDTALKVAVAHNLTLDWIYFGDNGGLENRLVEKITERQKLDN